MKRISLLLLMLSACAPEVAPIKVITFPNVSPTPVVTPAPSTSPIGKPTVEPLPEVSESPSPTLSGEPTPEPSPPHPVPSDKPLKGWIPAYDEFIERQVTPKMLTDKLDFCPNYEQMDEATKRKTWAVIFHGIAIPESGLKRTTRFREPGMKDREGNQVWSEGLLQLSYQDAANYRTPTCLKMDESADSKLKVTDPDRTIFDPYVNLGCGVEIADRLLSRYGAQGGVYAMGRYWSTMRRLRCTARRYIRENSQCGREKGGC
jgi:hypothetical protein